MNQVNLQNILNLSKNEKIDIVQLLWDNIAEESFTNSTEETNINHINELEKRLDIINSGNSTFKSWDELKLKYQ